MWIQTVANLYRDKYQSLCRSQKIMEY